MHSFLQITFKRDQSLLGHSTRTQPDTSLGLGVMFLYHVELSKLLLEERGKEGFLQG